MSDLPSAGGLRRGQPLASVLQRTLPQRRPRRLGQRTFPSSGGGADRRRPRAAGRLTLGHPLHDAGALAGIRADACGAGSTANCATATAASTSSPAPRSTSRRRARPAGRCCCPGFIDLHVHGGGGATSWKAATRRTRSPRCHARHGTTSLLATTMTAPPARDRGRADARSAPACDAARAGRRAHPRRAPGRPVHQPRQARRAARLSRAPPRWPKCWRWTRMAPMRLITVAPEMRRPPGAGARAGRRRHPRADRPHRRQPTTTAWPRWTHGAAGFTHLFNAMTRPAPPRARHGRRGAGACAVRRDHSRPAARAPGRDPRGAARDSRSCTA